MKIVYKKVEELKPYVNNPRFNDEAVEQVANSIKEFGFKVPMVIDKDNVIVAGHTRYKASLELGLEEVPCIIADDLSDEQVKAFRLADNKVSEKAQWDLELLEEELNDLDIDMSEFGFDTSILDSDEFGTDFSLPEGEKNNIEQITFTFSSEQATFIKSSLELVDPNEIKDTWGNENKNGNALYEVVREWVEQKKL